MSRCLACHKPLLEGEVDIHQHCARKLFREGSLPLCRYTHRELIDIAKRLKIEPSCYDLVRLPARLIHSSEESAANFLIDETRSCEESDFTLSFVAGDDETPLLIESLVKRMATEAHISIAPYSSLRTADGTLISVVDNTTRGRRRVVLPTAPLRSFAEGSDSCSCEDVARLISRFSTAPKLDCVNFFEIIYFSWFVGDVTFGVDSLRLVTSQDGFRTLAPQRHHYSSIDSSAPVVEELSLSVGGAVEGLSSGAFIEAMVGCALERKIAENMVSKFSGYIDLWCDLIEESGLSEELCERFKFQLFLRG